MNTQLFLEHGNIISGENIYRNQLLSKLPVNERKIECGGVKTAILEGGEGSPIILLHGQGEFSITWMRVFSDLITTHKIIVPDLPGHGASSLTSNALNEECMMRWLNDLIDQTCETPPVLAGHLLGGAIAARYSINHNDKISKLVLVDAMGLSWYRPKLKFAAAMIGFIVKPTEKSQEKLFDGCFTDLNGLREELSDIWVSLSGYALELAQAPEMKSALQKLMPRMGVPAISEKKLKKITVPTTLIWGRDDLQVNLRVAQKASKKYGWPLYVVERAADDPAFEQPNDFITALRTAL